MRKISDYLCVQASDSGTLTKLVRDAIKDGWEPYGGVAVAADSQIIGEDRYAQAMVRWS